jgi:hypothetical protein
MGDPLWLENNHITTKKNKRVKNKNKCTKKNNYKKKKKMDSYVTVSKRIILENKAQSCGPKRLCVYLSQDGISEITKWKIH